MNELSNRIEQHVAALRQRYPGIDCRVDMEDRPPHLYERRRYNARLQITIAARNLVINREHDDDPYRALDDAFAAAQAELDNARTPRLSEPPREHTGVAPQADELTLRIAERANRLAARRDMAPGSELALWLQAEAEVKGEGNNAR